MSIANRHYEKFTSIERCKLALSALNRDDIKEAEHLWSTAPIREYRAPDLAFKEYMSSILLISGLFFQHCVRHYNLIKKADSYLESEWWESRYIEPNKELSALVETVQHSEIAKLKGLYQAMREFCTEAELNYDDIMKQIPIKESHMDVDKFLSSDVVINDAYKNEMKELFLLGWK